VSDDVEDDGGPDLVSCPRCGAQYLATATATTCVDCGARLRPPGERPAAGEEGEEVGYDLADWSPQQRDELVAALAAEGVAARLEDTELVVAEADADLAEELIEEVDAPDALEAEADDGDDAAAEVLSSLYVTSDVLVGDPDSSAAVLELLESVEAAASLPLPYGLDGDQWAALLRTADDLADLLGEGGEAGEVSAAARRLRDAVHPLV
jgi:hypothetical protein